MRDPVTAFSTAAQDRMTGAAGDCGADRVQADAYPQRRGQTAG